MDSSATRWGSRTAFIFAAAAAAVGLGNIWRFPYLVGQNGGGAFVITYLIFVAVLGIPLILSEMVIGRVGRNNPVAAMRHVAERSGRSKFWGLVGGWTMLAGFLILTYYIVISGWVLDYFFRAITGQFHEVNEAISRANFEHLTNAPWKMLVSTTVIAGGMVVTIALGVKSGLERAVLFMFPAMIVIMLVLLVYSISYADFGQAVRYLFVPHFDQMTTKSTLLALGQAFFSLNVAMGVTMMFSAYLPKHIPLASSAVIVAIADTAVALLAGLIIFPVVFANHLKIASGPGLIFKTLPIAFAKIPFGNVIAALFFIMLLFAAFTSVIALMETVVAWLGDQFDFSRFKAACLAGVVCWWLSLLTIVSFSHEGSFSFIGATYYSMVDYVTADIMLPVGGILIAFFTGWLLDMKILQQELGWQLRGPWYQLWRFLLRFLAPIAILLILIV
ncbi:MAG: sodium-dependent transporter [Coxiellaceae bacterium]|nr:sodium-dependent transporter [Coxiellaceae bacterium]